MRLLLVARQNDSHRPAAFQGNGEQCIHDVLLEAVPVLIVPAVHLVNLVDKEDALVGFVRLLAQHGRGVADVLPFQVGFGDFDDMPNL